MKVCAVAYHSFNKEIIIDNVFSDKKKAEEKKKEMDNVDIFEEFDSIITECELISE